MSRSQVIHLPEICLEWSEWVSWAEIHTAERLGGAHIPNRVAGVYEAKHSNSDEYLTIGKASDLRRRIRQCLVTGKGPHSSGTNIRANEDLSTIEVRWAATDRPAAVEEELHRLYKAIFGKLPKYTKHT
jgi:hypothetical protein